MNNFITLYRYEFRKLMSKKIVWISFALCVVSIVFSIVFPLMGTSYQNGVYRGENAQFYLMDKKYAAALSNRAIDQTLLEETMAAYRRIPADTQAHYTLTEEYQQHARPYSAIFNFICGTTGMQAETVRLTWQPDENDLYAQRQSYLSDLMRSKALTAGETRFWQGREAQINKPFVYEEHEAYATLLAIFQTVGFLELLLVPIALSGVFYEEHSRKTDQITLACSLGKTRLYWVKIAVGIKFSLLSTLLLSAGTFLTAFCLYGTEGFGAAFQLLYARSSDPLTCGQAILIAYGCMVFAAVCVGVIVMVLSETLRSNMAALAASTGMLFLAMIFNVPEQYRAIAQIWNWLPWCFLAPWNVFHQYTLSLFDNYFTSWQAVPILYLVMCVTIALVGKAVYRRYQIAGR